MNLLADENIPASIVRALQDDGHDVVWIRSEAPGISDEVAAYIREVIRSRQDWEGHFSVIDEERIRMRPLSR
jgi:hypothetical protein